MPTPLHSIVVSGIVISVIASAVFAILTHYYLEQPPRDAKLSAMLQDLHGADPIYQPTNYWQNYAPPIVSELRHFDVNTFRRARGSLTDSFGALDLAPDWVPIAQHRRLNTHRTQRIPGFRALLVAADRLLNDRALSRVLRVRAPYGLTLDDLRAIAYESTARRGKAWGAVPLERLSVSRVGDPEDAWTVDGRTITMSSLYYYLRYAYIARFVDFHSAHLVVELGSGAGKQAEVLHALHPHLTIALFDLSPQLFVAEQFLTHALPGKIVPYADGRTVKSLCDIGRGRIGVFGNWRLADLITEPIDLFWNAASFQEMEPNVVTHYLSIIRPHVRDVYIQAMMEGQTRAAAPGAHGVLAPTTLKTYADALPGFMLRDLSDSYTPFGPNRGRERGYSDSIWTSGQVTLA